MPPRKRPGLGKGLDALIPQTEKPISHIPADIPAGFKEFPVNAITPNPRQPRASFDADELSELAESIQEHGIIQPQIITHGEKPDQYSLIAGDYPDRAAAIAARERLPDGLKRSGVWPRTFGSINKPE